jgi:hypothetical protein
VILETIGSLIVAAIGAGLGWAATEFVARPIRKFFDLRGDAVRMVSQYGNLPARFHEKRLSDNETRVCGPVQRNFKFPAPFKPHSMRRQPGFSFLPHGRSARKLGSVTTSHAPERRLNVRFTSERHPLHL